MISQRKSLENKSKQFRIFTFPIVDGVIFNVEVIRHILISLLFRLYLNFVWIRKNEFQKKSTDFFC